MTCLRRWGKCIAMPHFASSSLVPRPSSLWYVTSSPSQGHASPLQKLSLRRARVQQNGWTFVMKPAYVVACRFSKRGLQR